MSDDIRIPRPQIHTGPKHQTVDEATIAYLTEAAERVRRREIWGSGVSALVAKVLDDAAASMLATPAPEAARERERHYDWCSETCGGSCERSHANLERHHPATDSPPALLGGGGSRKEKVDALARLLMQAWENAEGKPVNPSYVATFADMARAVLAADARSRRTPAPDLPTTVQADRPALTKAPRRKSVGNDTIALADLDDADRDAGQVLCGSFGCTLPAGHNQGQVDIPDNHRDSPAEILVVELDEKLGQQTTCKVYRHGRLVFSGRDWSDIPVDLAATEARLSEGAEELATAWTQGYRAGWDDRQEDDENPLPAGEQHDTPNPYRRTVTTGEWTEVGK